MILFQLFKASQRFNEYSSCFELFQVGFFEKTFTCLTSKVSVTFFLLLHLKVMSDTTGMASVHIYLLVLINFLEYTFTPPKSREEIFAPPSWYVHWFIFVLHCPYWLFRANDLTTEVHLEGNQDDTIVNLTELEGSCCWVIGRPAQDNVTLQLTHEVGSFPNYHFAYYLYISIVYQQTKYCPRS